MTMEPQRSKWKGYMSVHPQILCLYFARGMAGTVQTDFIINYTCKYMNSNDSSVCELLHNGTSSDEVTTMQSIVQPKVAEILTVKSLIDSIFPAFLSLFLGSWSDQNGRKPLLLAGYLGSSLAYSILIGLDFTELNPWYLLIAFIPPALLGGFCTLMMATYCYITDITSEQERDWHLVFLEASMAVGNLVGLFTGPLIFNRLGYIPVFGIAVICCLFGFIYVCCAVSESVTTNTSLQCQRLCNCRIVKSFTRVILKKRPHFNRCIVWCCVLILMINVLIVEGEFQVGFLFLQAKLSWNVQDFSTWLGVNVIAGTIGTLLGGRYIGKIFGISNITVAIMANFSPLSGAIVKSLTNSSWHMYLAILLGMFGDVTKPLIRTQISKSVPSKDIGKVFSLNAFFETLIPFAAGPLYTLVYAHSMPPIYPCPVWYVSVSLYSIMIILAIVIRRQLIAEEEERYGNLYG